MILTQSPKILRLNRQYRNSYFEQRGVTEEVFNEFFLGILIGADKNFYFPSYLVASPTFPVYNISGDLKGYGFRPGLPGQKYMIFGFKKREQIYGIPMAYQEILNKNKVYIVEGYFDVLLAFSRGIRNVVSIFGNTISDYQAYTLGSITDNFVLALDSDSGGLSGSTKSERIIRKLLPNVHVSKMFVYPFKDLAEKLSYTGEEDVG